MRDFQRCSTQLWERSPQVAYFLAGRPEIVGSALPFAIEHHAGETRPERQAYACKRPVVVSKLINL